MRSVLLPPPQIAKDLYVFQKITLLVKIIWAVRGNVY